MQVRLQAATVNPQLNTTNHECECDLQVLAFLSERSAEAFTMRVPVVSFLVLIAVVGAAGNVLVLTVYSHNYRPCSTTVFILAMAACDLFTNVVALPMQIISIRYAYNTIQWRCRAMFATVSLGTWAGTLLLVPVAYDRFWKVWRPTENRMTHRKSMLVSVCTILTACAIYGPFIPIYGVKRLETGVPGIRANICWIKDAYRDTAHYIAYKVTQTLVFYTSLLIQIVLYSLIAVKLVQQMKNRQNTPSSESERRNRDSKLSDGVQGDKKSVKDPDVDCTSTALPRERNEQESHLAEQAVSLSVPVDHDTPGDTQPRERNDQESHLEHQAVSLSVPRDIQGDTGPREHNRQEPHLAAQTVSFSVPHETQGDLQPMERNGQEPHLAAQTISFSVPHETQGDMQPMERNGQEPHLAAQTVSFSVPHETQGDMQPMERNGQEPHLAQQAVCLNVSAYRDTQGDMQSREPTMSRVEEMPQDTCRDELNTAQVVSMSGSLIKDTPEGSESGSNAETRYLSRRRSSISTSTTDQRQSVSPGDVTVGQAQTATFLSPSTQQNMRSDIGMMSHHKANESRNVSTWSITQTLSFKRKRSHRQSTSSHYSRRIQSKTTTMMVLLTVCYIINWLPSITVRLALFHLGIICFLLSFSFFFSFSKFFF